MAAILNYRQHQRIANWLLLVMILVMAMIALGGATRLTNSGLSITEWKPITGALPPLSHDHWVSEFEKYKQIPEFSAENPDMTLKEFEFIYFMEWSHRQLGRLIGLAYAIPFLFWAIRGALPRGKFFRFFSILLLIGLQGAIGWWMVASGLVNDRVDVSQYRLATHLGLAFIILGVLYLTYLNQRAGTYTKRRRPIFGIHVNLLVALVYLQIIAGAFVAGTHAGRTYNTWPLMDNRFVPSGYDKISPFWRNLTENITAIQFNHRFLAYIIFGLSLTLLYRAYRRRRLRVVSTGFVLLVLTQTLIGILTLLHVVPLPLALMHQFTAILVFLSALTVWYRARNGY